MDFLNLMAESIHADNKAKGFWDGKRNTGELLMLVTSELGEALEAHRKDRFANLEGMTGEFTPEKFKEHVKDTFEDEIADTMIRLFDLCGGLGIDIGKHINLKLAYNRTREKLHGKKY